jgi:hypothetical protein
MQFSIDTAPALLNAWATVFRSNSMNRQLFVMWLIAATPALLFAQEAQLVNCRTLEAAGNFVGPDEVIDGNMVCQKLKPGSIAPAPAKIEAAKPQPDVMVSPEQAISVAEAARLNKQRLAAKQNAASATAARPAPAVSTPVPVVELTTPVSKPATPEVVRESAPAAVPALAVAVSAPPAAGPAPAAPLVTTAPAQRAAVQSVAAASAADAPPMRIKRDAPVAAGTPSEPPERDYGFSDANAVATPVAAAARAESASRATVPAAARTQVQMGGFDRPKDATSDATSATQNANTIGLREGQRPECTKNITLGSLKEEKLDLGKGGWAQAWIAKNQKAIPNVCFSETPMRGARNYLIVFYFMPSGGNLTSAMAMPDSAPAGAFTAKNGAMWSYTGGVTQEVSQGQVWYATAYAEDGAAIAEEWPEQAKRGDNERVAEELLNGIVEDLRKQ